MLNNILTITNLLYLGVGIAYLLLSLMIVRSVRGVKKDILYEHQEYTDLIIGETKGEAKYDHQIVSKQCPVCYRTDTIHINQGRLKGHVKSSRVGIGQYHISHDNHDITHYFDINGKWLADKIPSEQLRRIYEERELTKPTKDMIALIKDSAKDNDDDGSLFA